MRQDIQSNEYLEYGTHEESRDFGIISKFQSLL